MHRGAADCDHPSINWLCPASCQRGGGGGGGGGFLSHIVAIPVIILQASILGAVLLYPRNIISFALYHKIYRITSTELEYAQFIGE